MKKGNILIRPDMFELMRVRIAQEAHSKNTRANQGLTIVNIVFSENMDQRQEPLRTVARTASKEHMAIQREPSILMPVKIVHRVAMVMKLDLQSRILLCGLTHV